MRYFCIIIVALLAGIPTVMAQRMPADGLGAPVFEENIGFFPGETSGTANLEVYLRIPFDRLQFVKISEGYSASFEVLLAIYEGKKLVTKFDRRDSVYAENYYETHSLERAAPPPYVLRNVPPGRFELRIAVKDLESSREYSRVKEIAVPTFDMHTEVQFSSVIPKSGGKFYPADAYPDADTFEYEFSAIIPESAEGSMIAGIEDSWGLFVSDTFLNVSAGSERFSGSLPMPAEREFLFFAEFQGEDGSSSYTEKNIRVLKDRYSASAEDIDEVIDQLDLIGTRKEIREMRSVLDDEISVLDSLIGDFWAQRDPTPSTEFNEVKEEFYRRIEVANNRYGGVRSGWETARGRIMVVYGEPDEIERRPFEPGYPSREIWYYNNPRRTFIFEDRLGDGRYELVYQE